MNFEMPLTPLPDLSARIMRETLANELHLDWNAFCRHKHLKPFCLDEGMTELLARDEGLLQEAFAELTANHSDLWFQVGLRYRSIKFGAMGFAMMTARTLGEALEVACRYQALTYSLNKYRYAQSSNGACALIVDDSDLPPHLHKFTQHRDLGTVRTLVADLMAGEPVLERVAVAAAPPANWAALSGAFPCPVQFDADRTEWWFQPGSANRTLPLADRELATLYKSQCDHLLEQGAADAPVTHQLATLLSTGESPCMSAYEAAKQLSLSERTLHRRLAEEGTRYFAIVDSARLLRSRELLADRRMTIEAIATAVGFAEPSSFSRAFKRWTGTCALEYRSQMMRKPRLS